MTKTTKKENELNKINSSFLLNKAMPILIIIFSISLFSLQVYLSQDRNQDIKIDYSGCFKFGFCEINNINRPITSFDVKTNIHLKLNDSIYQVMQSRTLTTGDFGKYFLLRVK